MDDNRQTGKIPCTRYLCEGCLKSLAVWFNTIDGRIDIDGGKQ